MSANIREIIEEEQHVQRHKAALDALVRMRSKRLGESLEARMRRAQDDGEGNHFSEAEWAVLHQEEKLSLQSQLDRLRQEQVRTKGQLAELRRLKAQATRIRAAEVASERKRHRASG